MGASPPAPELMDNESIEGGPIATQILSAAKLTGRSSNGLSVGVLGTAMNPDQSDGSYSVGGDWSIQSPERNYAFRGQVAGSFRLDDVLHKKTKQGVGTYVELAREGGEHFRVWTNYRFYSPDFDPNDLGFLWRSDLHDYYGNIQLRRVEKLGPFSEIYTGLEPNGKFNTDGLDLGQELRAYFNTKWT
jgi:hypothetical protein